MIISEERKSSQRHPQLTRTIKENHFQWFLSWPLHTVCFGLVFLPRTFFRCLPSTHPLLALSFIWLTPVSPPGLSAQVPFPQKFFPNLPTQVGYPLSILSYTRHFYCNIYKNVLYQRQKQPKCLSVDEWIRKMWYIQTMEYYTALKKKGILIHATT